MKIEKIEISARSEYDTRNKQSDYPYHARVRIDSEYGAIEMNIKEEKIKEILSLVSEAMVDAVKDVAQNMNAEIIQQSSNLLEVD